MKKMSFNSQVFKYVFYGLIVAAILVVFKSLRVAVSKVFSFIGLGGSDSRREIKARQKVQSIVIDTGVSLKPGEVVSDALVLARALGVSFSWIDPRSWTEDESAALAVVRKYNRVTYPVLSDAYAEMNGRSLAADLVAYLSPSEYAGISAIVN